MHFQLPRYRIADAIVEAFMITNMDVIESRVVLWGPNGIRLSVRESYVKGNTPNVGGYYVCFADGAETFVDALDFHANFQPIM